MGKKAEKLHKKGGNPDRHIYSKTEIGDILLLGFATIVRPTIYEKIK